jgi:hypothetical protein
VAVEEAGFSERRRGELGSLKLIFASVKGSQKNEGVLLAEASWKVRLKTLPDGMIFCLRQDAPPGQSSNVMGPPALSGALLRNVPKTSVFGVLTELLGLLAVVLLAIGLEWLLAGGLADAVPKSVGGVLRPSATEVLLVPESCGDRVDDAFSASLMDVSVASRVALARSPASLDVSAAVDVESGVDGCLIRTFLIGLGFDGIENMCVARVISAFPFDAVAVLDVFAVDTTVGKSRASPELCMAFGVIEGIRYAQSIYCAILPRRIRDAHCCMWLITSVRVKTPHV